MTRNLWKKITLYKSRYTLLELLKFVYVYVGFFVNLSDIFRVNKNTRQTPRAFSFVEAYNNDTAVHHFNDGTVYLLDFIIIRLYPNLDKH